MIAPARLTLQSVFKKLKEIALMQGNAVLNYNLKITILVTK